MQVSSSYKLIFLGALATLLAIVAHGLLPQKRLQIYPAPGVKGYIYADELSGGHSQATWIDQEQMHWRCDVKEGVLHRYCGFHIAFDEDPGKGLDLTRFDAIKVKLAMNSSDSRVRIYMRNFEEGFSREDDIETAKFNNVLIPITDLNEELTIELREFSVAEWWINERNVPRQFAYPSFNDVRTIAIDLGVPPAIGVHEIKLESLYFVGDWITPEQWYRGILLAWVGLLALLGLARYIHMKRRLSLEREHLARLASYNSKLKDESEKYRELSTLDKLTGTLNRHGFDQALTELKTTLPPDADLALILFDLDHFKRVNDEHGHDVGDKVLKKVADVLASNIRRDDRLARWGGEEFLLLCPRLKRDGAFALAEKLRNLVATLDFSLQPPLKITTSVGVGGFQRQEVFEEAFKRVDIALYKAKRYGRNRTEMTDEA